ncbi:MAG TPA: class F sortase [Pseudonocardiaceae bacterium]|nr:class F sortase [Pseudonocardiaceae bacterium]
MTSSKTTDWPTRLLVTLAVLLLAAGVAAGIVFLRSHPVSAPPTAPLPPARSAPPQHIAAVHQVAPRTGRPKTVSIAAVNQVDIPVVAATVVADQLEPPADVHRAGIWTGGAPLAATAGTTTLVGHVNYVGQGNGAFHDLASVPRGATITTVDGTGAATTWTVTSTEVTDKTTGVDPAVFAGPTGPRRLVLVTCGGRFDANIHSYDDNVYVWAVPAA